jgi:AcrR family transcriptional regulator
MYAILVPMAEPSGRAASLRARVRAQMTDEIKSTARRHVAADGAANLSLRAVARDVGLVSSAIYRYFASRDELLTALIIDAYNAMGAFVEEAESRIDRVDLVGRFLATGHAVRDWATEHPHEYALTYGSPVPGYAAPQDTVGPATRVTAVMSRILADGFASGALVAGSGEQLDGAIRTEMERVTAEIAPGVPPAVMARGMIAWTEVFGAVSFEVFGRLNNVIENRRAWFDHQLRSMATLVGLA